jgi:Uma2 family endonuclease
VAIVRVKGSVRLSDLSEPQPDLALLRGTPGVYPPGEAGLDDVLLIVEVVDTTMPYDRGTKVPFYARSGVPEVWLADLIGERVLVYREPGPDGYRVAFEARGETRLSPQAFPSFVLTADEIVGGLG